LDERIKIEKRLGGGNTMRFRKRIKNLEKLLPAIKAVSNFELQQVSKWLVQNSEEFMNVLGNCSASSLKDRFDGDWCKLPPPSREKAEEYMNRIDQLIDQHLGRVT